MDIYNMAAFPRPGSPEWIWYQQMQMRMNHGQGEPPGPTPADFQAFNLRPQGQGHQRNIRPRFMQTGQRSRRPPPPYYMVNQHMMRNSTPQNMMNPRMYQPPGHMDSRPMSANPIEGLQELAKGIPGPQGPSPPINHRISPANQRVSMDTTPRGPSPLSYMETSQALPVTQQVPTSGSQARSHLHPNVPQYMSHPGMRMPMSMNSHPIRYPPPLMKVDGTLVQRMEQFSGPWTGQPGNAGYRPGLQYNLNGFQPGKRTHPDQIHTPAPHGGQTPNLSVSTDNNSTNSQQAPNFQNANSLNKDIEVESLNSQSDGTLSNSIFGRWYKPPAVDDEVKYDYIFDVDGDTQTNVIDKGDLENTSASKTNSHLIKRPSRLSVGKKGMKGKRLEGEISRIVGSFQAQLSPLGSNSLPESRTGFETEPDIFSVRSGNNNVSSDQSHSQAAQPSNIMSSSNVHMANQFLCSYLETDSNVTRETDKNGLQDINHPKAAHNKASSNVHMSQQVTCPTSRPMPPLIQAPMAFNPMTLQPGQQLLPPALTNLSTNHSASLLQSQSNPPVMSKTGSVSTSAGVTSDISSDRLSNPTIPSPAVSENNICILDTFSLSHHREGFVGDIVIQPQEINEVNVNPKSSKSSLQTNMGEDPKNKNQVNMRKRRSSECESNSKTIREEKKVTPLRIRLPFILKSRLQDKLKKNTSTSKNNIEEDKTGRTLQQDPVSSITEGQRDPIYSETETLRDPLSSVTGKCVEPVGGSKGETAQHNAAIDKNSICTKDRAIPKPSIPTTSQIEKMDNNKEQSGHKESSVNSVDRLSATDNKNTHIGNGTDKPNDPHHLMDRLKEVVSKISSGRKRRKSAVLLEAPPCTPDAKRRRLSKEKDLDSDVGCQKNGTDEILDSNDQQQNSCVAQSNIVDLDKAKDVSELSKQPGGSPSLNTQTPTISCSEDTQSSKQQFPLSRSLSVNTNASTVSKETVSGENASIQEPASQIHIGKPLEEELTNDDDLPKIVRSPRLRKVRASKRPWLIKNKGMDIAEAKGKTGDSEGPMIKSKGESKVSPRPMIDKSKEESLEKKKSDIEKCRERTKSLRLQLRRISYPPSSLKNLDITSKKQAMVNQVPEEEKKLGAQIPNKGTGMESLEKDVTRHRESTQTDKDSVKKHSGSVDNTRISNSSYVDENMNNNNSGISEYIDNTELSTVVHMDSPIIEEPTVVVTGDPVTVLGNGPITEDFRTCSAVTEDLTVIHTDSPVTIVSKDKEDILEESDGEVELINVGNKPKDTFDINIVDALFFPVKFHGSKLLCVSCLSGKYFVVRELLNKCFLDIAEKNRKKGVFYSKLFKQVYVAKERDLNIPYVELPEPLRTNVDDYLVKEQLLRKSLVCHIGIIHVNDAKRLYHFFYGVKSCHDLKCVLPWPSEDSKETVNQTDGDKRESRQGRLKPKYRNAVVDSPVVVVENVETDMSDSAQNGVEIITCHVIFDREVEDTPEVGQETLENSDTSKLSGTTCTDNSAVEPANCLKVPNVSPRNGSNDKLKRRLRRGRLSSGRRRDLSDVSDDCSEASTIPYMDEAELVSDVECDERKLSSSVSDSDKGSFNISSDVSGIIPFGDDNADLSTHGDVATVNSNNDDENSDDQQEIRIDPDLNEDYVVRGGIAELYDGMFRFLVINGRKFFPFEDLCQHYEKEDLINCLKSKPGHFKAIRCSMIETDFLNNLEPSLPVLVESATIIEEDFLHCSAKLNFRKMFDTSEQEVVDLTTDDDAVVPQRLADSPVRTPEASPTLTKLSAFESFSNEDMLVDTSDDILMMELGTANCDTSGKGSIHTKEDKSADDLSVIDGREQKAVADAFRDIWVENHSLKSKMAMMTQDIEESKKETMDFEATCQQYGDAIELMTKAIQQTCSEDQKKDLS